MTPNTWIAMILFYVLAFIYTVIRKVYMKKKHNINIFDNMRKPHQPWLDREEALKKEEIAV
jgi:hypothetical protein